MEVVLRDSITGSMTDKEFFKFCLENKNLRIERNNKLEIVIMSPVSSLSSLHSSEIFFQLANWSTNGSERIGIRFFYWIYLA